MSLKPSPFPPSSATMADASVAVVVVPFPAQGHLNQLLHFSLLLSSHGLPVHYAASTLHTRQARSRIHGWPTTSISNIHFLNIPIPTFSAPPPDPTAATAFPSHLFPAFEASEHIRQPLATIIRSLSNSHRRVVIVQEALMSFAGADAAELPNVEIFSFQCVPVFFSLPYTWDPNMTASPEAMSVIQAVFEENMTDQFHEFAYRRNLTSFHVAGTLVNTCRPIESEFIDLYQEKRGVDNKIYAVGPVNPLVSLVSSKEPRHECLNWLDKQTAGSVVYVSFGTTCVMPEEQIQQLAAGLKSSGQRFIWVLRDADKGDIFEDGETRELLPGFEDEVEGVGVVVRGWAPQLEILGHTATGVFLSHCGWNSCMESLSMGVPMLAWAMHSDQPSNAMVVTEYLKVGVHVREWGRRKEIVTGEEIAEAVKKVMVKDEGKEMKRKVKELSKLIRSSSGAELGSFVAYITR